MFQRIFAPPQIPCFQEMALRGGPQFDDEKRVAVMVNNLGATTEMELAIAFLSSLDMAGVSISVLGVNDEWLRWLDAATTAPAWPNVVKQHPGKPDAQIATESSAKLSSLIG